MRGVLTLIHSLERPCHVAMTSSTQGSGEELGWASKMENQQFSFFPGRSSLFSCRGHGFRPRSGTWIPHDAHSTATEKKKACWDCHGLNCVPEFTYGSPDPQHLGCDCL